MSKGSRKRVEQDEADATIREAARVADAERQRVYDAADIAAERAAQEVDAVRANRTFWAKMREFFGGT